MSARSDAVVVLWMRLESQECVIRSFKDGLASKEMFYTAHCCGF